MELLNEIRPSNQITLVNLLHFWNRWECKRDKTVEFVTWLNMWDCWMCGTDEWDMNEKLDNTTEFATLLNVWGCWMKLDCWIK